MNCYDFRVSDLWFRVQSPRPLRIPENFLPFLAEGAEVPDWCLQICFEEPAPGAVATERFHWSGSEYILRMEPNSPGEPYRLYIPQSFADGFCQQGNWMLYLALERMLLPFDRLIIHASAVVYQGKAYLFSAPSGGGKSTHANLWNAHYGAKLLNGDKVVVYVKNGTCTAYGSPVAGSSGIYENDGAPIGAIFAVHKAPYNRVTAIPKRTALLELYSQTIKSGEDSAFNTRVLDLLEQLLNVIPVRSLECLPEKGAVDCVLTHLEGMTQ